MDKLRAKKLRIEILLVLVVVMGSLWLLKFGDTQDDVEAPAATEPIVARPALITGPNPETFGSFKAPEGELIRREIECSDSLYVVLVFKVGVDYRVLPREAVYNSANACKKGDMVEVYFDPKLLADKPGKYYLIVGDQGSDVWYNPR